MAAEQGLPKTWLVFDPCAMCGATVPKIEYAVNCATGPQNYAIKPGHEYIHFHVRCWRCGYEWITNKNGTLRA